MVQLRNWINLCTSSTNMVHASTNNATNKRDRRDGYSIRPANKYDESDRFRNYVFTEVCRVRGACFEVGILVVLAIHIYRIVHCGNNRCYTFWNWINRPNSDKLGSTTWVIFTINCSWYSENTRSRPIGLVLSNTHIQHNFVCYWRRGCTKYVRASPY